MQFFSFTTAALLACAYLLTAHTAALPAQVGDASASLENGIEAGPDPKLVYVQSISYGGSGCPNGSVGQSISDDRSTFTLIFDKFVASTGPGIPLTENRKNCQLTINLHIPQGWSYSMGSVDYRGYVQLPAGVTATQKAIYYFQGSVAQVSSGADFRGPVARDYLVHDEIPLATTVWSECNAVKPVNVNAQVRINGVGTAPAQITTDSIDGKVKQVYALMWKRC